MCPRVATSDFHLPNNEPTTKCVLYLPHSQIQVGKHQKKPSCIKKYSSMQKKAYHNINVYYFSTNYYI